MDYTTAVGTAVTKWFRFYIYLTANPTTDTGFVRLQSSGTTCGSVMVTTRGTLCWQNTAFTQVAQTTATLALNQWVRVEGKFVGASGTGGSIELKLFNVTDSSTPTETQTLTGINTTGEANSWAFGEASADKTNFLVWFDDIAINDTGYPGPALTAASFVKTGGSVRRALGTGAKVVQRTKTGGSVRRALGTGSRGTDHVRSGGSLRRALATGDRGTDRAKTGGAVRRARWQGLRRS